LPVNSDVSPEVDFVILSEAKDPSTPSAWRGCKRRSTNASHHPDFCENANMRLFFLCLLTSIAAAQSGPRIQISNTTESLRGVSAVSREVAWASGTNGTYLRTIDGGRTWTPAQVPDAGSLDFRAVVAFSADEAFLMSAGPGEQSRIYHTSDVGKHWQLQFTNSNPKGFFDSMAFWDSKHGIVLGDPIPDEHGKLKFELLQTEDGESWKPVAPSQLPDAIEGEGAFAASNSCLALLTGTLAVSPGSTEGKGATSTRADQSSEINRVSAPEGPDHSIWFATGGKVARIFHSSNRGQTWEVFDTPILHGADSTGIFSIAFRDPLHGVISGGDYKHPKQDGPTLAFTEDGGKTWALSSLKPQAYFSAIAYDRKVNELAIRQAAEQKVAESTGKKIRIKPSAPERLFIVGPDFVFDFRPPNNPRRIGGKKKQNIGFNAVSALPDGGALVVGPKGSIALIP
jgi:photosystem II stability/assembly factor-like uncharacterized protein